MLATRLKYPLRYKNIFLPKLKKQTKIPQKQSGNGSFGMFSFFFFFKGNMLSFISTIPKTAVLEGK